MDCAMGGGGIFRNGWPSGQHGGAHWAVPGWPARTLGKYTPKCGALSQHDLSVDSVHRAGSPRFPWTCSSCGCLSGVACRLDVTLQDHGSPAMQRRNKLLPTARHAGRLVPLFDPTHKLCQERTRVMPRLEGLVSEHVLLSSFTLSRTE